MLPDSIRIQSDIISSVQAFLTAGDYSQIGVLVDSNTSGYCYPKLREALPEHTLVEVPPGEEQKNLDTCTRIWTALTEKKFDRHALLIVLGGGVLGDMGGFCAATYKRGIDFLLLPTTLLAQVDASIGGKLGIDFQHYKNHIGVFQLPIGTYIGTDFLKTLPERELRSGFAEVIKHCLTSDQQMWDVIRQRNLEEQQWEELIKHSVAFKHSVVESDPREKGLRKVLNFGHTVGHALETYFLNEGNRIFHGEAIAVGMICESFIATEKGLLDLKSLNEIAAYILRIYGKNELPNVGALLGLLLQDKKNKGNKILMALPEGIGKAQWDVGISEKEIQDSIDYYDSL